MAKCEALTASGAQCKHSAKDDSIYCGIHQALEGIKELSFDGTSSATIKVTPVGLKKWRILVMAIGTVDVESVGILGASTAEEILQRYSEQGYDVHTIMKYDRVPLLGDTPEHFWTMWLLKLRE